MKVAVISASVPFVRGGAEMLEEGLVERMRRRDIEVVHVRIPVTWSTPADVRWSMAAAAGLELPRVDRVIPLKFPGWHVAHPNKVAWVFHQFRQVYDLWEAGHSGYDTDDPEALALKQDITSSDTELLGGCRAVHTYSPTNAERLRRFNGVNSTLLHSPIPLATRYRSGPIGDQLVSLGRVCGSKRQLLAVEALARTERPVRLVIAGVPDPPEYGDLVRDAIARLELRDRVEFHDRFIEEEEKVALLEHALGSVYIPIDEDNFGYVTAESFMADRPVVTATDSGGVCWIVEDGLTGFVVEPRPDALARAFDTLWDDRVEASRLGQGGHRRLSSLRLDWDHAIETLLA